MTPDELVGEVRARGADIRADDGRLMIDDPDLVPDLLEDLRAAKAGLIALLEETRPKQIASTAPEPEPLDPHELDLRRRGLDPASRLDRAATADREARGALAPSYASPIAALLRRSF